MKFFTLFFSRYPYNFNILLFVVLAMLITSCRKKDFKEISSSDIAGQTGNPNILKRTNIIVIMGDDIGYEVPTVNGGQSYETPNLDLLAKTGMRFTQCHSSPFCAPSRWMLVTGKYNFRNFDQYGVLGTDQRTFANMLHDNGYATAVYGKWAMDGGDTSIHIFGFDQYAIWNPYKDFEGDHDNKGSHYKNPSIYDNGNFIADSLTEGKYGDDIFTDSLMNFIEANKNKNFFAYYPMTLCHAPLSPTPDDPEFAAWHGGHGANDTAFFPSMVKYTDKLIGKIVQKVKDLNIANQTAIIVIAGDNGCQQDIVSIFNGYPIQGGRQDHTEIGTHVPLFIYWPGTIAPGIVNDDLIDFTDFLPTIADIAGVALPTTYGTLDGTSFYPQLIGEPGTPRDYIFCHYEPFPTIGGTQLYRWAQNKTYKLYDTSSTKQGGGFYNIVKDVAEKYPLPNATLSTQEKEIKKQFQSVFVQMHL